MFGIVFEQVHQVAVRVLPDPEIQAPGDAIVQVEMAGLCGSDLHPFWGREQGLEPGTVMGHEFVGRVVATGDQVRQFSAGDLVFAPFSTNCGLCDFCHMGLPSRCPQGQLFGWRSQGAGLHGGQAQFVRVPMADGTLLAVPPQISHELALLLGDNLSTGHYCTTLADIQPDGTYAILGCGNVGLMAIVAAQLQGCQNLIAIDPVPERREMAERLGARAVEPGPAAVEVIRQLTDQRGADGVLELVGLPTAQRLAYDMVRPGGVIATVGCHCDQTFAFSPIEAYDKNLTYRTGRCPARHLMASLVQRPAIQSLDWRPFITHVFELHDGPRAYEVFSQRREGIIKGVFDLR
jgi:threonine dehydrogenase-like Zn-dependent dehydrogenase